MKHFHGIFSVLIGLIALVLSDIWGWTMFGTVEPGFRLSLRLQKRTYSKIWVCLRNAAQWVSVSLSFRQLCNMASSSTQAKALFIYSPLKCLKLGIDQSLFLKFRAMRFKFQQLLTKLKLVTLFFCYFQNHLVLTRLLCTVIF